MTNRELALKGARTAVAEYFTIAQGVTWLIGIVLFVLFTLQVSPLAAVTIAASTVVIAAAALLTGMVIGKRRPTSTYAPLGYQIESVNQTYEFHPDNPRVQRLISEITIRAERSGVILFYDRTKWTGQVPPDRRLLSAGRLLLIPEEFEGWQSYIVVLPAPLEAGESTTVRLRSSFIETSRHRLHWVSKTILEPVGSVRLSIIPNGHQILGSNGRMMHPGRGDDVIAPLPVVVGAGRYTVLVTRPLLGRRYYLDVELEFTDEPPLDPKSIDLAWST